jgi:hypothetical protein
MLLACTAVPSTAATEDIEREYRQAACRASQDQLQIERISLDLLKTPQVQKARREAAAKWRASAGNVSPEMEALFPAALEELVFDGLLRAVALSRDPPVLVSTFNLAHDVDGKPVPGSRFGWDGPDMIYGKIAIDPEASYVITGWLPRRDMQVHFSVADIGDSITRNVSMADLKVDADGRFRITVSAKPGSPAENHIQVDPTTAGITLRETLTNWQNDRPVYMSIQKTSGERSPLSQQPSPTLAAKVISGMVDDMVRWRPTLYLTIPVNTIRKPSYPADKQGLPNQAYALGRFKLTEEEALIIDVTLGGARYFNIPVYNIWGVTGDYRRHTSTFNNRQTIANPDGSFTYVLSPRDPGIHNWLSTNGWSEGDLTLRWQELTSGPDEGNGPSVRTRLVKLSELSSLLPAYVKRITPAERAAQIEGRQRFPVGLWGQGCVNGKTKKGEPRP